MTTEYAPGQRWISEAEPDLGLATVTEVDDRCVRVHFSACGEQRTYARRSAPLLRVRFSAGDQVEDQHGRSFTVTEVQEQGPLLCYAVNSDRGVATQLPEGDLNDRLRLDRPQDKLFSGRIDSDEWFSLRHAAWLRLAEAATSPCFGLTGPRVELVPHQLYIAAEVARREAPRVLLADEVGLGKTIEAGLILHQLLLAERVERALIVVPETLLHQWLVEMRRRFNLEFALFDSERFDNANTTNPFFAEQHILCSLEFLTASPEVATQVSQGEWDLLVVDEAHHLTWTPDDVSPGYTLVDTLARRTRSVLLLTATPEQLGRSGHFARLRLLDPERFHDYQTFVDEERDYAAIAELAQKLSTGGKLSDREHRKLVALDIGMTADKELPMSSAEVAELISRLVDRHGTGRILFRNTRNAVAGFPSRVPELYPLEASTAYLAAISREPGSLTPESLFGDGWWEHDPRVGWLVELLTSLRPEKVLVIAAKVDTVVTLREALRTRSGIRAAVFHEQMSIIDRDRAAAYFAQTDAGAQTLICSEIGSEGRNFQFAHHLVLFDLPMEPDLLEQRIGRLDRIGQSEQITIHLPFIVGSAGESLSRWYNEGLQALEKPCPAANAVRAELSSELDAVLSRRGSISKLITSAREQTETVSAELEAGRDRLLELHSHRPEAAQQIIACIRVNNDHQKLHEFAIRLWDASGIEHEPGPGQSTVVRPTDHMSFDHFPGLSEEGLTVSWSRADALAHEERAFLTWEHPMVRGAMEMLTSSELGSTAVSVVKHPGLAPGAVYIEKLYVVECFAPPELEAGRYLPPTCIRRLMDSAGREIAGDSALQVLAGTCVARNRRLIQALLESRGETLRGVLSEVEESVTAIADAVIGRAVEQVNRELGDELQRLRKLAERNPNVRQEELDALVERQQKLVEHIADAGVRLDAVRLIVGG